MVIEPAKASEIATLVIAAYELSPREADITRLIAGGLATGDKVGVTSRGELVAKLFVEYTEPATAENTVRVLG